jgi:hypothetical protein
MIDFIFSVLKELAPVTALGWALAIAQAIWIATKLTKDTELRDKLVNLSENHTQVIKALQEDRIEDLKELLEKQDAQTQAITAALEKFARKRAP